MKNWITLGGIVFTIMLTAFAFALISSNALVSSATARSPQRNDPYVRGVQRNSSSTADQDVISKRLSNSQEMNTSSDLISPTASQTATDNQERSIAVASDAINSAIDLTKSTVTRSQSMTSGESESSARRSVSTSALQPGTTVANGVFQGASGLSNASTSLPMAASSTGAQAPVAPSSGGEVASGSFNDSSWQRQRSPTVKTSTPPYPLEYELYQQKYGVDAFNRQMFQRNFAQ